MNAQPLRPDEQVLHQGDVVAWMRPNRTMSFARRLLSRRRCAGRLSLTPTRLIWARDRFWWRWLLGPPLPPLVSIELTAIRRFDSKSSAGMALLIETADWTFEIAARTFFAPTLASGSGNLLWDRAIREALAASGTDASG